METGEGDSEMSEVRRRSESARRDEAFEHRGEVVPESGRPVEPRRVPQVVSLRLHPDLLAALRTLADARGTSVSELLREGAEFVIIRSTAAFVQWRLSQVHHEQTVPRIGDVISASSVRPESIEPLADAV